MSFLVEPSYWLGVMHGAGLMGWVVFFLTIGRDRHWFGGWEVAAYSNRGERVSVGHFRSRRCAEQFVDDVGHEPYRLRVARSGHSPSTIVPKGIAEAMRKISRPALGLS